MNNLNDLDANVKTQALLNTSLVNWRKILSQECEVYVFGENYLAKRFDQINYKFCEKNEAKEILIDNLYALLRFKYFPKQSEEVDERIKEIVSSMGSNLKTTLIKLSFDYDTDAENVSMLPDYCIAFRNGVYDFKNNCWFFKYSIIKIEQLRNTIYLYNHKYIIFWYININFEPLPISIKDTPLSDFIQFMKELTKDNRNYCFELLYNISHDVTDTFDYKRFEHVCEVLGYTLLQSFSQYFVLLIGSGQNGKNSLFDGCFINRVIPRPAANDMDAIENDRFITGALENKAHNIFLETSAKMYTESKMIKALTGSMYQTIEIKGIPKYSGIINCKYLFAGNDQEKIKFSDTTNGFRRRINILEIWYQWDSNKRFMKKGDYYDTTFSDNLSEIKNDISNTICYVYFGMYGLMLATKNFTENFKFTYNDWKLTYTDIDVDIKDKLESITKEQFCSYLNSIVKDPETKTIMFDIKKTRLYNSYFISQYGVDTFDKMIDFFNSDGDFISFFADNDIYLSLRSLQSLINYINTPSSFTKLIKKLYTNCDIINIYNNKPYIKCTFVNGMLKIINQRR